MKRCSTRMIGQSRCERSLILAASFSPNSLQSPSAWLGHVPFAAWIITETSPRVFVECGTHSGNSYFSFCQAVVEFNLSTKCYAVDTWKGDEHSGWYGEEVFHQVNAYHQERYAGFSRLLRMTFEDAAAYFADGSIDLLHIDGLHTYDAAKHDFETWLPKLAAGAVVLFHDTNVREHGFGVWQLWEELQRQYPLNMEFVHSHGLGVLQLGNGPTEKQLPWLVQGSSEQPIIRQYFAALGKRQLERFELNVVRNQLARLTQDGAARDAELARLTQDGAARDAELARLKVEMMAIRGSTSWRLTAPIRVVGNRIKRLRRMARATALRPG